MHTPRNVLGGPLLACSLNPRTGWYRDGCCNTDDQDLGNHTVCARVTAEFLTYLRSRGNDLITPRPEFGFPGLAPGDRWCVCAGSWREAWQAGFGCEVYLEATHERALEAVPLEELLSHAVGVTA